MNERISVIEGVRAAALEEAARAAGAAMRAAEETDPVKAAEGVVRGFLAAERALSAGGLPCCPQS